MATHSSALAWTIPGTGGAWWAAVCGVAQSQTGLKRFSSSMLPVGASLVAPLVVQRLKRLPPMRETWVLSLDQEDPLEKGMATLSSILAGRIP